MKLIRGNAGLPDGWIPPPKVMNISPDDLETLDELAHEERGHESCFASIPRPIYQLYDVVADPSEEHDLAEKNPAIVMQMAEILREFDLAALQPFNRPRDKAGLPSLWNNTVSPGWCQALPK